MEVAILHALILTVTGTDRQVVGSLTASAPRIAKPTSAATRSYATAAAVQWVARVLIPIRSTGGMIYLSRGSALVRTVMQPQQNVVRGAKLAISAMKFAILHASILTVTGTDQQVAGPLTASAARIAKPTSAATRSHAWAAAVPVWIVRVLIPLRSMGGLGRGSVLVRTVKQPQQNVVRGA